MLFRGITHKRFSEILVQVLISLARVMLFRAVSLMLTTKDLAGLNLSCESNAFQGEEYGAG